MGKVSKMNNRYDYQLEDICKLEGVCAAFGHKVGELHFLEYSLYQIYLAKNW